MKRPMLLIYRIYDKLKDMINVIRIIKRKEKNFQLYT